MSTLGHIAYRIGSIFAPLATFGAPWRRLTCALYTGYIAPRFRSFGSTSRASRFRLLRGARYVTVGDNCFFDSDITLTAIDSWLSDHFTPSVTIGSGCSIGAYSHITCINSVTLGRNVLTGKRLLVTDNSHGLTSASSLDTPPLDRPLYSPGPVTIGDNVWIGENVSIMPGVTIGQGCIIAAGAIVTKSVPPYSLVAGIPARVIRSMQ